MNKVQLQRAGVIKAVPAHEVDRFLRAGYSRVEQPESKPAEEKKSTRKKATQEPEE